MEPGEAIAKLEAEYKKAASVNFNMRLSTVRESAEALHGATPALLAGMRALIGLLEEVDDQRNECVGCGVRHKDGVSHLAGCEYLAAEVALAALGNAVAE